MVKKRLYNIDFVKGCLIIFVILGHFILGTVEDTLARYVIYSFHMPIFIAVSGFLVKKNGLASLSLSGVVKKYIPRVMIPWGIAVIVYTTITEFNRMSVLNDKKLILLYINSFLKPYYHLWYILGFLSYILLTWFLLKLKLKNWMLLLIALVISIISMYELYHISQPTIKGIVEIIQYDFRIYNYLFFILGMLLKEYMNRKGVPKVLKPVAMLTLILAIITIYFFYQDSTIGKRTMYFLLNIPFAVVLLGLSYQEYFPRCKIIEYIGQNSMAFYLWHVLVKLLAISIAGAGNRVLYYCYSFVFFLILSILIFLLSKISFINKYLLGGLRN